MNTPSAIHFTRKQMFRIIYGAMRDLHKSRIESLWIARRECKAVTVRVVPVGEG